MDSKKEILRNFAGLALTAGLAIATQGRTELAMGVLNGISGNLASSFIEKTNYNKIKDLLNDTDPSDLNHDLKKLIIKSVEWAIKNIQHLYKKQLTDKDQIKHLQYFTENLLQEVKVLNDSLMDGEDQLYGIVEGSGNSNEIFNKFDLEVDHFPIINESQPYPAFFKDSFKAILKLCFGELLKQEKNRPAYIAYQREVYQNLSGGIDQVIEQNTQILAKLDDKLSVAQQNDTLQSIRKKVDAAPTDRINPELERSLENQLFDLSGKADILIIQNDEISSEIRKVKDITKGISKDLKTGWVEKNKARIITAFGIAAITIVGLFYYLTSLPFQMNLIVEVDPAIQVHREYPSLSENARIKFFLPSETEEKEVTFTNEIILNDLSKSLFKSTVKADLLDPYWELSKDSLLLDSGQSFMFIRPNASLGNVEGRVLSRDGQELIDNATIEVEGILSKTNGTGDFSIEIPIQLRKMKYVVRVEKEGYKSIDTEYIPGTKKEIRLTK